MTKRIGWASRVVVLLVLSALASMLVPASLAGDHEGTVIESTEYYTVVLVVIDGVPVHKVIINGPPEPPSDFVRETVALPEPHEAMGINTLSNVPAFDWSYGCSATSAAMIAGYYDRTGYPNMYAGPTNGGVMPLDNNTWGHTTWPRFDGVPGTMSVAECPLSATHNGVDGRATKGHVDDYWVGYAHTGSDPFIGNWTEHTYGDCTGDYMKTSQSIYGNTDGATTFWYDTTGAAATAAVIVGWGVQNTDGGYGHKLFYESRVYTVTNMYNQYIQGYGSNPALGFTYAQYKAEIDAGRPVMIHVTGHTMVGVGYDDSTNLMYFHDTWDHVVHTMTWGGTYGTAPVMYHMGVTIVQLAEPEIDVRGLGNSIPDGDTSPSKTDDTDFGSVNVGSSHSHTFTIHNTGAATLLLTGSPTVQIGGVVGDWTVTTQPASTSLAPAGSTTFTVRFSPSVAGLQALTVTIANTDLNENPYNFSINGTGASTATAATFRVDASGNVFSDATFRGASFQAGAADVAEWVSVSESVMGGAVVELDPDNPGSYRLSSAACSPLVAGVISTDPGVILGRAQTFEQRALLALIGIAPTRVTGEGGPILPGDLLVTSSTPGHAMRWAGPDLCPCSLVGKALEPMTDPQGTILVLLTAH